MTILYLYAELMGYQIPVFKEYVEQYKAKVHVVHWDKNKLTPYQPPKIDDVFYYARSKYEHIALEELISEIKPDIVYVSGWMDKGYLRICKILKLRGIPIVAGSDTQVKKTLKQKLGVIYFKLFLKKYFSYIWVAGPYQYEYARKLGFTKNEIIFNCLSADITLFSLQSPKKIVPKKFIFVGRLEQIKGVEILLDAWKAISDKKDSTLTFVGNGSLKNTILSHNIEVIDFLSPEKLSILLKNYGILILPSLEEPWALVIQEAMASGLPVIASNVCGAAPVFITNNFNGFLINPNNIEELKNKINYIINLEEEKLVDLAKNALEKSTVISPKLVAASFISVI
ncbi:glycosyltransferase family 4 protein [Chryseobacterium sp. YIM B08800]|uniref:glycosyltransferase family 4 protein n=1 Tax=Chryseobacterium sp. YIM B08800 TaxID=2984136 RepID=UPI00224000D6|nr:glycosyltransferase family 4 protein [Chryseobacterium sp. YIM B08800]